MIKNALKKLLRTFMMTGGVLVCVVFSGCENFMNGADLKEEVAQQVEDYLSGSFDIEIALSNANQGFISPSIQRFARVGTSFDIEFRMNNEYNFTGFEALDRLTMRPVEKAVHFSDPVVRPLNSYTVCSVTVTVLKANSNLIIRPVCGLKNDTVAPKFTETFNFACSREDFEKGKVCLTDNMQDNHVRDNIYFNFEVKEADSTITKVKVREIYNNDPISYDTGYKDIIDFKVDRLTSDFLTVSFDYALEKPVSGSVEFKIIVVDDAQLQSEEKSVTVYADATVNANFYLTNPSVVYHEMNYSTYEYEPVTDDSDYGRLKNGTIYKDDIEAKQSQGMQFTLHSGVDYWGNGRTEPSGLKWSYAYAGSEEELNNKSLTSFSFAGADYDGTTQEWSLPLNVPLTGLNNVVYVKVKCIDIMGNEKSAVYKIPAFVPVTLAKYISPETKNSTDYKVLHVKASEPQKTGDFYTLIYCHQMNYKDNKWCAIGESTSFAPGSGDITSYLTSKNSSYTAPDFETLDSTEFYTQMLYHYKDFNNKDRYIYGYVSEAQTADYITAAGAVSISVTEVTAVPDKKDTHTVTVTLPEEVVNSCDYIYVRKQNVFSGLFNDGNSQSFTVGTSYFYDASNSRVDFTFSIIAVKNGIEYTSEYTIPSSYSGIKDNVSPDIYGTTTLDYTGKYLKLGTVSDTGAGMPYYQPVEITYRGSSYDATRTVVYYSSDSEIYIPVGHLPGEGNSYLISLTIEDSAGNKKDYAFTYSTARKGHSYSRSYDYSAGYWKYTSYDEDDLKYEMSQNSGTTYQFRIYSSDYSYGAVSGGEFNNLGLYNINVAYDMITDSTWNHIKDTYTLSSHSSFTPYRVYTPGITTDDGYIRFSLTHKLSDLCKTVYLYQRGKQTLTIKDIINGSNGIQVYSDKPFLVHTLWSEVNYGDDIDGWIEHCVSNPSVNDWSKTELNPKCLTSDYSATPYYYQISSSDVPEGCYYAAIVHFADNTSLISTIRKK